MKEAQLVYYYFNYFMIIKQNLMLEIFLVEVFSKYFLLLSKVINYDFAQIINII